MRTLNYSWTLLVSTLCLAQSGSTSNAPSDLEDICKKTFSAQEMNLRLIYDHLASELSTVAEKISSPEFEDLKSARSTFRERYTTLIASGAITEARVIRHKLLMAMAKLENHTGFSAQKARLKKENAELTIRDELTQFALDRPNRYGAPQGIYIVLSSSEGVEAQFPVESPKDIRPTFLGDPRELALNRTSPECQDFVAGSSTPSAISTRIESKSESPSSGLSGSSEPLPAAGGAAH